MSQNTRSVQAIERVVRLELEETEKHLIGIVCSSFEIDDVMASRWGSLEVSPLKACLSKAIPKCQQGVSFCIFNAHVLGRLCFLYLYKET